MEHVKTWTWDFTGEQQINTEAQQINTGAQQINTEAKQINTVAGAPVKGF
jgi:hypothetical protein